MKTDFGCDLDPQETAKELIKANFQIEQYEEIQEHRYKRLKFFIERNISVLIKNEQTLIAFGEEVLRLMREHKTNPYGRQPQ